MRALNLAFALLLLFFLAGCGTFVPTLRNWPNNATDAENNVMVQAILGSVRCELQTAVKVAIRNDIRSAQRSGSKPRSAFLDGWGVESLVTLTIVEKTAFNPTAILTPAASPALVPTIAGGLDFSAEATRVEKINTFYTVRELFLAKDQDCRMYRAEPQGSLLVANDLQIANLLTIKIDSIALGQAGSFGEGEKNVLSHQVGFQTIFGGEITPTVKLVRATVNPSGTFLKAGRDQTHELLLTFGPLAQAPGGRSLVAIAEQTHFSSQITSGITNGFRSALQP